MTSRKQRPQHPPRPPAPAAEGSRSRPALLALGALVILAVAAGGLLHPVWDFDLFTHLRTGRWIWEHKTLPAEYLFSPHDTGHLSASQRFTLTSYWAVQVLYHLLYSAGGLGALVALRFLLAAGLLATLLLRREGDDLLYLALVAASTPLLFHWYTFDRPQVFSFIFFSLMLGLLDRLRRPAAPEGAGGGQAAAWLLPPVMCLWANSHGGYLLGQAVLGTVLAAESVKLLHPHLGPLPRNRFRRFAGAGLAGLGASLLNPNSWRGFSNLTVAMGSQRDNFEYLPVIEVLRVAGERQMLVYLALLALAAAALARSWRSPDITAAAVLAVTGWLSFRHNRYVAFFVLAALPFIGRQLTFRRPAWLTPAVRTAALAAAVAVVAPAVARNLPAIREPGLAATIHPGQLPVEAADFLEGAGARGTVFNQYSWGGYLLWRLEDVEVFIDGRVYDQAVFDSYVRVLKGEPFPDRGLPSWREAVERHRIGLVVLAPFDPVSGVVPPLYYRLMEEADWHPVFLSRNAMILARDLPANRELLGRYGLGKSLFRERLLETCDLLISESPGRVAPYLAKGDLLMHAFRLAEARRVLEQLLTLSPGHVGALRRLREMGAVR